MKKRWAGFLMMLYIFYCINQPNFFVMFSPLFSNAAVIVLLLAAMLVLYPNLFLKDVAHMLQKRFCKVLVLGLFVSAIYYALVYSIANIGMFSLSRTRIAQNIFPLIYFLHALFVCAVFKRNHFSRDEAFSVLFAAGALQGMISALMFIFPSFKEIANKLFVFLSKFNEGSFILTTRIFGLASDYTFGMPIAHGILSAVCLLFALRRNRKYIFLYPLILVAAVLNSRTGVLISIIGALIVFFGCIAGGKIKKGVIVPLAAAIVIVVLIIGSNKRVAAFIGALFQEATALLVKGEKTGTAEYLLETHLFFPKGLYFIFGEGHRPYGKEAADWNMMASDIGYVNDMFMGGLIYCATVYFSYIQMFLRKNADLTLKMLYAVFAVSLAVANLKGQVTVNHSIIPLVMLCTCFIQCMEPQSDLEEHLLAENCRRESYEKNQYSYERVQ